MNLKVLFLSWLLHHGNRGPKRQEFYEIKNSLLKKYGRFVRYDVQHIEGKKCWTCAGTGIYDHEQMKECRSCDGTGYYRLAQYNILSLYEFGPYTFHQPWKRCYEKPDNSIAPIIGYIEHKNSKYCQPARAILYILFKSEYLKTWYHENSLGWRTHWWLPRNWFHNILYLSSHHFRPPNYRRGMVEYSGTTAWQVGDDLPF